jgi:hypothetical protein
MLLDENDRLELFRSGPSADLGDVVVYGDLQLVFGSHELSEHEATERVIVLSLPIRKATSEKPFVEELESLAGLQPPSCLVLRDVVHAIRPEEGVDGRARRLEPSGRRFALARRNREDG